MPVIKAKSKLANRNTGGNKKQGLVPSTGKSRMMRQAQLSKAGANDKTVYCVNQVGGIGRNRSMFQIGDGAGCVPKFLTDNMINEMYNRKVQDKVDSAISMGIRSFRSTGAKKIYLGLVTDKYYRKSYIFLVNNSEYKFDGIGTHIDYIIGKDDEHFINRTVLSGSRFNILYRYPIYVKDSKSFSMYLNRILWNSELVANKDARENKFHHAKEYVQDWDTTELIVKLDYTNVYKQLDYKGAEFGKEEGEQEILITTPSGNNNGELPVIENYEEKRDSELQTNIHYAAHADHACVSYVYSINNMVSEMMLDDNIKLSIYTYSA